MKKVVMPDLPLAVDSTSNAGFEKSLTRNWRYAILRRQTQTGERFFSSSEDLKSPFAGFGTLDYTLFRGSFEDILGVREHLDN